MGSYIPVERGSDADCGPAKAAIDCGTNSTRLLIVDAEGRIIDRQMEVTRLGEAVDSTRKLAPEAIARTVVVLERFKSKMDGANVTRARLVATSAVRDAANSGEFMSAAEAATGVRPEVLSGSEEGCLAFAGATRGLPDGLANELRNELHCGLILVVDIGGGSTELVVGSPGGTDVSAVSIDIGCVRLTERFLHGDPPSPAEMDAARSFIDSAVSQAKDQLPVLVPGGWVVGLAGTVATLAGLANGLDEYERTLIHQAVITRRQVDAWVDVLAGEPAADRAKRSKMLAGRADVIVGGALVLSSVMRLFDRSNCLMSEDDILDGLVASISY